MFRNGIILIISLFLTSCNRGPAGKSVGFSHFTPKALNHIDIYFPVYNDS